MCVCYFVLSLIIRDIIFYTTIFVMFVLVAVLIFQWHTRANHGDVDFTVLFALRQMAGLYRNSIVFVSLGV